jgi:nucleoside-diphosphate-sugar epimerase
MPTTKPLIIVTGSSGFIGYPLCESFAADGFRVMGFDRPGAPHPPPDAENIPCDLTSDASVAQAVARVRSRFGARVAAVAHLAAYYDFTGEPSPMYDEVTVRGTQRLLHALNTMRVEQFLFASTMLVHAPCQRGQHIDEDWPQQARWDYPESKLRAERLIADGKASMRAVLLRIAGVYTDRCEAITLAHQIQRIRERRVTSKVFPGDTFTGQSFVHLDDVVQAFRCAVQRRERLDPLLPFLVGEPEPLSYDELQRTFAWLLHREPDWETTRIPKSVAKAGAWVQDVIPGIEEPFIKPWMIDLADDHYALDITRARRLLGWEPRRSLRETLPRMIESLRADPTGWYRDNKLEQAAPGAAAQARAGG